MAQQIGRPDGGDMPTAVVRVTIDRDCVMSEADFRLGLERLTEQGFGLVGTEFARDPRAGREIRIRAEACTTNAITAIESACLSAFGVTPVLGAVTYISRGTDGDARGVLARFGVEGVVERDLDPSGEEIVTVTVSAESERRVPESRLHTALEAALNCEVRIVRE